MKLEADRLAHIKQISYINCDSEYLELFGYAMITTVRKIGGNICT